MFVSRVPTGRYRRRRQGNWAMDERTDHYNERERQRKKALRAADVRECRARQRRRRACYMVEVDEQAFELMETFEGLAPERFHDRREIRRTLGRLLRRAVAALLRETARKNM